MTLFNGVAVTACVSAGVDSDEVIRVKRYYEVPNQRPVYTMAQYAGLCGMADCKGERETLVVRTVPWTRPRAPSFPWRVERTSVQRASVGFTRSYTRCARVVRRQSAIITS